MGEIVYLNLNSITLWGWERRKSLSSIEKMIRSIYAGIDFPAVPIKKLNNDEYSLVIYWPDVEEIDGGHHRAIAHYKSNVPLKCELVDWGSPVILGGNVRDKLDIKEIELY